MNKRIKKDSVKKVPLILQMEAQECGAACLAMVMAYYGRWIPLHKMRTFCGVSRDGSNAKRILNAAREQGMKAKGLKVQGRSFVDFRKNILLPCILFWNGNHFVVLCGFRRGRAVIKDPERGELEIGEERFWDSFTGICFEFEPGEDFCKTEKQKEKKVFIKKYIASLGPRLFLYSAAGFLQILLSLFWPVSIQVWMEQVWSGTHVEWLAPFLFLSGLVMVLQAVGNGIRSVCRNRMKEQASVVVGTSFMWKLLKLPMFFFDRRMTGELVARISLNEEIANLVLDDIYPFCFQFLFSGVYLIFLFFYKPWFAGLAFFSMIIYNLAGFLTEKNRRFQTQAVLRGEETLYQTAFLGLDRIESIKCSGMEDAFLEKWAGCQAAFYQIQAKAEEKKLFMEEMYPLLSTFFQSLLFLVGLFFAIRQKLTIGMLLSMQGILFLFLRPSGRWFWIKNCIQKLWLCEEHMEDAMEENTEKEQMFENGEFYEKLKGEVELKHVTFGYSKQAAPVISDFSICVKAGQKIAVVGASGCGKSTISRLLSGLYEPWEGEILLDGKRRDGICREVLSGSLAVVDQEIVLFEDSISDNIKMWDESIEDFEVILAARDAKIHEDIMLRDGGYSYQMRKNGTDFSGGQKQRIEIARVLSGDPTIVILDEATSALDAQTEEEVIKAVCDRGITCIMIAHRLSAVRDCDAIAVMEKGKLVEYGTHEELYAKNGTYWNLIKNEG